MASVVFWEDYSERYLDLLVSMCRVLLDGHTRIWSFGLPPGGEPGGQGTGKRKKFY